MLEFTLTQADLAAFAAHQAQESGEEAARSKRLRLASAWLVGIAGYLVVVVLTAVPLLLNSQLGWAAVGEVVALGFGFVLGLLDWRKGGLLTTPLLGRRYRFKAREALAATGAVRRLTLDDGGLTIASGTRATRVPWAKVQRLRLPWCRFCWPLFCSVTSACSAVPGNRAAATSKQVMPFPQIRPPTHPLSYPLRNS